MAGKFKSKESVNLTTGIGVVSFPRVFTTTKGKNDRGEDTYDVQLLIPKTQREDVRAILAAIKKVGEAQWGANWKKVRTPLRDGDAEKDELTEDGTTKAEKYPERLGHYFINARSTKPVGVYDRALNPIVDSGEIYGGCKAKIAVTFYAYSQQGNHGVGCGLNGLQKISDGEPFGNARPSVESMFDMLEDDDLDLDDDLDMEDEIEEEEPEPAPKKGTAKKAAPAKKAAAKKTAKKKAEPEEIDIDEDEDDLYDDLDDDI